METEAKPVVVKPNTPRLPPAPLGAPLRAKPLTPARVLNPEPKPAPMLITKGGPEPKTATVNRNGRPDGKCWRFAKLWGVAEELRFEDKTSYTFPLIPRNDQPGYSPTSSAYVTDETLAKNLRGESKKNDSIREVKVED